MYSRLRAARGERGFTLVELLVVIAILGVLAGVVVFSVAGITDNSQLNSCKTESAILNTAVQSYYANQNPHVYAANAAALVTAKYLVSQPTWYDSSATGVVAKLATAPAVCP